MTFELDKCFPPNGSHVEIPNPPEELLRSGNFCNDASRRYWAQPLQKCVAACKPSCIEWTYDLEWVEQKWQSIIIGWDWEDFSSIFKYSAVNFTEKAAEHGVGFHPEATSPQIVVRMYTESGPFYTITEEKRAMEFADFVSNIGGTLGLYTGMSIIGIVHLLERSNSHLRATTH